MSDDEVQRRHLPLLAVAVLVVGGLAAWMLRGHVVDEYQSFRSFCSATRGGEPWQQVKDRAAAKGWEPVRQSREGAQPEEWLFTHEFSSYRVGCVVSLAKGRVITTRLGELPDAE